MKKNKGADQDELRAEYKRADFSGGLVRGKYAKHFVFNKGVSDYLTQIHDKAVDLQTLNEE